MEFQKFHQCFSCKKKLKKVPLRLTKSYNFFCFPYGLILSFCYHCFMLNCWPFACVYVCLNWRTKIKGNFSTNYSKRSASMFDVIVHLWYLVLPNNYIYFSHMLTLENFFMEKKDSYSRFWFWYFLWKTHNLYFSVLQNEQYLSIWHHLITQTIPPSKSIMFISLLLPINTETFV